MGARKLKRIILGKNLYARDFVPGYFFPPLLAVASKRFQPERIISQSLGCCPFNRELGPRMCRVRVVPHKPGQAKIGHLNRIVITDQTIPRGQIAENPQ